MDLYEFSEAATGVLQKEVLLKIWQISQENTCVGVLKHNFEFIIHLGKENIKFD